MALRLEAAEAEAAGAAAAGAGGVGAIAAAAALGGHQGAARGRGGVPLVEEVGPQVAAAAARPTRRRGALR